MPEVSSVMPFTADFTAFQMNNKNEWTSSTGGVGVKRQDEIESETKTRDDTYLGGNTETQTSKAVSMGDFSGSYGSSILTNISRDTNQKPSFMNPSSLDKNMSQSQEAIQVSMDGMPSNRVQSFDSIPTTPATLPSDLTTFDRLNTGSSAYDVGSLTNPATLGDTLSGLVEKVHANAASYEAQSDSLANKSKGTAFDQAKDSMISSYDSLSGGVKTKASEQTTIERQIENYMQVMNGSYEYYIYSSLFVDSGKAVSQTAQTLTKG
jgi:hypothetical protein